MAMVLKVAVLAILIVGCAPTDSVTQEKGEAPDAWAEDAQDIQLASQAYDAGDYKKGLLDLQAIGGTG